uniref:Uncharacterized protein n=1 Tax=Meloidogyne enterolobii TaxID=390850 RepID=A0A6V7TR19_MELEN|nr:unnamed protein product [Meloidogyne enterolobii]
MKIFQQSFLFLRFSFWGIFCFFILVFGGLGCHLRTKLVRFTILKVFTSFLFRLPSQHKTLV